MRNVFTVDLEEWFHVCGVPSLGPDGWDRLPSRIDLTTSRVLDLLDRAQVTATFFVVGWIADRYPQLIARVQGAGHQIGSHGYAHQRAYELGPDGFLRDLRESVASLERAGVPDISVFRAPEWSINARALWALEALAREGFSLDASMAPLKMVGDPGWTRYPHLVVTTAGPIVEAPPLVADRFGQVMPMGWGWGLRMSAPRRILRTIEAANRLGHPAVLMVHPWEFDPDPPRVRLPWRLQFAHYFRLDGFPERVREVLEGAEFGSMKDIRLPRETP